MKTKTLKIYLVILCLSAITLPAFVFGQTPPIFSSGVVACDTTSPGFLGSDFKCTIARLTNVIGIINPILFSLSFIVFFWGLTKFILNSDSKDEIEKGKNYMIWAIIALFMLITFRAIITFVSHDLGIGDSSALPLIPHP